MDRARVVLFGVGAANVATYRLLNAYGLDPKAIVACDSKGILHRGRKDIEREQAQFSDTLGGLAAEVGWQGSARAAAMLIFKLRPAN